MNVMFYEIPKELALKLMIPTWIGQTLPYHPIRKSVLSVGRIQSFRSRVPFKTV
jgi:hypothetical protein